MMESLIILNFGLNLDDRYRLWGKIVEREELAFYGLMGGESMTINIRSF